MERVIKRVFLRGLSFLLAFLTVITQSASLFGEFSWFVSAEKSEINNLQENYTETSKNECSVLTEIAFVGSGVENGKGQIVADAIASYLLSGGNDTLTATYYTTFEQAKESDASLVIYACGTHEAVANTVSVDDFKASLSQEVNLLKSLGKDVLLVTPGPVIAYGENGFYANNTAFTPTEVSNDINIYNTVSGFSNAIKSVASLCDVGVVSVFDEASLYGVNKYMSGTQGGIYPADYDCLAKWIASYISKNFIIATEQNKVFTSTIDDVTKEVIIEFDESDIAFNAIVINTPNGSYLPQNITVQTSKTVNEWYAPVAKTNLNTNDRNCDILFDTTLAQYIRLTSDSDFPAQTEISFYKTRLSTPIITSPEGGQILSANTAFNVEWSDVANANQYVVTIKQDGEVVKQVTTPYNVQAFPVGVLPDSEDSSYTVSVEARNSKDCSIEPEYLCISNDVDFKLMSTVYGDGTYLSDSDNVSADKFINVISESTAIRDGAEYFNRQLVGVNRFSGAYTPGEWLNGADFAAIAPVGSSSPVEFIIDLNRDYKNTVVANTNHHVTALNIGFAQDITTISPSSITVAVQKMDETTWTTVGGRVLYTNDDTVRFVNEQIPLTAFDASDVYAAKIKVTLYTNEFISQIPEAYDETGFWGKWFALSYIEVIGNDHIDSAKSDGATAVYNANFLRNPDLITRTDFGDVNNNEIWNSIAWKSASYKIANSGYSKVDGGISIGKIYWASENAGEFANVPANSTLTNQTPSAVNPEYNPNKTTSANIAQGKEYYYIQHPGQGLSGNAYNAYKDSTDAPVNEYHKGTLTDGNYTTNRMPGSYENYGWVGWTNGWVDIVLDLGQMHHLERIWIDMCWGSGAAAADIPQPSAIEVWYSADSATWSQSFDITASTYSKYGGNWRYLYNGAGTANTVFYAYWHDTYVNADARYIWYRIQSTGHIWIDELYVDGYSLGNAYTYNNTSPQATGNSTSHKTVYATVNPGTNVSVSGWILHNYGISSVQYRIDGGSWNNASMYDHSSVTSNFTYMGKTTDGYSMTINTTGWSPGVHNVAVWLNTIYTPPGSSSHATAQFLTVSITINDVVNPVVKINSITPAADGNSYTVSYTASDNVGVTSLKATTTTDSGTTKTETLSALSGTYTVYRSNHNGYYGNYKTVITATDAAGLQGSASKSTTLVKPDTENPVVTINSVTVDPNGDYYTINYTVTDDKGVASVSVTTTTPAGTTKTESIAASGTYTVNRSDHNGFYGVYTSVFTATDTSGKTGSGTTSKTLEKPDAIAPTIENITIDNTTYLGKFTVTFDAYDNVDGVGIDYVQIIVDGGQPIDLNNINNSYSYTYNDGALGEHSFVIVAVDKNGNRAETSSENVIVLNPNPTKVTFYADADGLLRYNGDMANSFSVILPAGSKWDDADVIAIINSIIVLPFKDSTDGGVYVFSEWRDYSATQPIPSNGAVMTDCDFYANYHIDFNGTSSFQNGALTDGILYNGIGSISDYSISFDNADGSEASDYVIIDLGKEYYSLTSFDVSFYANADKVLPSRITFELSSKVYVPTLSSDAVFDDWTACATFTRDEFINVDGHYSLPEISSEANGRYVKVTFYYDNDNSGLLVDEIIVKGTDTDAPAKFDYKILWSDSHLYIALQYKNADIPFVALDNVDGGVASNFRLFVSPNNHNKVVNFENGNYDFIVDVYTNSDGNLVFKQPSGSFVNVANIIGKSKIDGDSLEVEMAIPLTELGYTDVVTDSVEMGYIIQLDPDGNGSNDMSYNGKKGHSIISSVRGEALNSTNGTEIKYTPALFNLDGFKYAEADGSYYFESVVESQSTQQNGTVITQITVPDGGAYLSFDWKAYCAETDKLSVSINDTEIAEIHGNGWSYNNTENIKVFSPLSESGYNGVSEWNNIALHILNSGNYTVKWNYEKVANSATSAIGEAKISNFRIATESELGYWKHTKNWDTLRLELNTVDAGENILGIKPIATDSSDVIVTANSFGTSGFVTLSYVAVVDGAAETKDRINISAENVPLADIENYHNNAVVLTKDYSDDLSNSPLTNWTVLEIKYSKATGAWELNRFFNEGVDKSKFNIKPDDETIILLVNYTNDGTQSEEAVLFGYANRQVLSKLIPSLKYTLDENVVEETHNECTKFSVVNVATKNSFNITESKQYTLTNAANVNFNKSGIITDGEKLSVYSNAHFAGNLGNCVLGYFSTDKTSSNSLDNAIREESIIIDIGAIESGITAFSARFAGGGEDGVDFPTEVVFSVSTDGIHYNYVGTVGKNDVGVNNTAFKDAYASIVYTGATDTVYGYTVADYNIDLCTVGVTARYIKATVVNNSAENAKTFITEITAIQNAVELDTISGTDISESYIDVSDDAVLAYRNGVEESDLLYGQSYVLASTATNGYADSNNKLTDGIGGATLYGTVPTIDELKGLSVGWNASAPEITFTLNNDSTIGYIVVYALASADETISNPSRITAYASKDGTEWNMFASVSDNHNSSTATSLSGVDKVIESNDYALYKYTLAYARDGELAKQLENHNYVKLVVDSDESSTICITEVEMYNGTICYPVYDLTEGKYKKNAIGLTDEEIANQTSEVRPTLFRGFYDTNTYYSEIQSSGAYSTQSNKEYSLNMVFNSKDENLDSVYANVEQRALSSSGTPYFYEGDQLLLRVTTDMLNSDNYNVNGQWASSYKLSAQSKIYFNNVISEQQTNSIRLYTTTAVPTPLTVCNVLARDKFEAAGSDFEKLPNGIPSTEDGKKYYSYLPIYMLNSLDYLKATGYGVDSDANGSAQFINMPSNKVELTGTVVWDTNTQDAEGEYINDQNGISLNLAPLGAKTNTDTVTYNGKEYAAETTLRFGSIWYIDDTAYYNTHTHKQQYGTILLTLGNMERYLTDTLSSKYTSAYSDYGIRLTKVSNKEEITGVAEITGIQEVVKLTGISEITEVTADDKYSFTTESGTRYWYCSNSAVKKISYTTTVDGETKYWGCNENVDHVNWIGADENGVESYWYTADAAYNGFEGVRYNVLADGTTVVYYINTNSNDSATGLIRCETDFNIVTKDGTTTRYWQTDEVGGSDTKMYWSYTTVEGSETKYWYTTDLEGPAGTVIETDGNVYIASEVGGYNGIVTTRVNTGKPRYWTAKDEHAFNMLVALGDTFVMDSNGYPISNEESAMNGLSILLDYINYYGEGRYNKPGEALKFGGLGSNVRANKYYYYNNISKHLIPENYGDGDIFGEYDKDTSYNDTELIGDYNFDQRYVEFDAILAGIPTNNKGSKVVAIPYAVYANNYEFLEFGETLGDGDQYVADTWADVFNKYYGSGNESKNIRYYVYGDGISRSVAQIIN